MVNTKGGAKMTVLVHLHPQTYLFALSGLNNVRCTILCFCDMLVKDCAGHIIAMSVLSETLCCVVCLAIRSAVICITTLAI